MIFLMFLINLAAGAPSQMTLSGNAFTKKIIVALKIKPTNPFWINISKRPSKKKIISMDDKIAEILRRYVVMLLVDIRLIPELTNKKQVREYRVIPVYLIHKISDDPDTNHDSPDHPISGMYFTTFDNKSKYQT